MAPRGRGWGTLGSQTERREVVETVADFTKTKTQRNTLIDGEGDLTFDVRVEAKRSRVDGPSTNNL